MSSIFTTLTKLGFPIVSVVYIYILYFNIQYSILITSNYSIWKYRITGPLASVQSSLLKLPYYYTIKSQILIPKRNKGKGEQSLVNPSWISKNWCLKMDARKHVDCRNKINRNIEISKHNFFGGNETMSQCCHFKLGLREAGNSPLLLKFQFHTLTEKFTINKNHQRQEILYCQMFTVAF